MSKFTYLANPYIVRADAKIGTVRRLFDIETDGPPGCKVHCVVVADLDRPPAQLSAGAGMHHRWLPRTGFNAFRFAGRKRVAIMEDNDASDQINEYGPEQIVAALEHRARRQRTPRASASRRTASNSHNSIGPVPTGRKEPRKAQKSPTGCPS